MKSKALASGKYGLCSIATRYCDPMKHRYCLFCFRFHRLSSSSSSFYKMQIVQHVVQCSIKDGIFYSQTSTLITIIDFVFGQKSFYLISKSRAPSYLQLTVGDKTTHVYTTNTTITFHFIKIHDTCSCPEF